MYRFVRLLQDWRVYAVSLSLLMLTGCPSDGERTSTFPKEEPVYLTGTVATGAPLVGANVFVRGRRGSQVEVRTSTTDAVGNFRVQVNGIEPPYVIKVSNDDGLTLNSVALSLGHVNVTLLTEFAMLELLRQNPSLYFDTLSSTNLSAFDVFTAASVAEASIRARGQIKDQLGVTVPETIGDFFTEAFTPAPGNVMDDAVAAVDKALKDAGLTPLGYIENFVAELARCAKEKVVLTAGGAVKDFCPLSRATRFEPSNPNQTNFSFTNARGNILTVTRLLDAITSVKLQEAGSLTFQCLGTACQNISVSGIASNGTRTIQFSSTPVTGAGGLVGTLQGTLLAAKSGLPPVACDGDKVFLTKNDGTILAGCGSFSAATGGDRLILDLNVSDSDGNLIINIQAKARSDTGEIISVSSYQFDLETGAQIVDLKCIAAGCTGTSAGPLSSENTRVFSFNDTVLQQVNAEGVPVGPAIGILNAQSVVAIPSRVDQVNCIGSIGSATLSIAGERSVTVCPFDGAGDGEIQGFYLDEGRTQVQHIWSNVSTGAENGVTMITEGTVVKELEFSLGFASFACKDAACAAISVSGFNAQGRRTISFSAALLRERDIGGLPGERTAELTGILPTVTLDCLERRNCPP